MKENDDFISELERLDRWIDGEEEGEVPLAVLRAHGMEIPEDESALDDPALRDKLWEVIRGMSAIGMVIELTDHLTDRELYRYLIGDALLEPTILPVDPMGTLHVSPIGGGSEEDNRIHLQFYADDEEREEWHGMFGDPLPAKQTPPADRDRFLPTAEMSRAEREATT